MTTNLLNNRFQIIQSLGSGNFSDTYLAQDTSLPDSPKCYLRVLKLDMSDPDFYEVVKGRFDQEVALLVDIGEASEQILSLYEHLAQPEGFYLVHEWVEGKTLAQLVHENGPFLDMEVKDLLTDVLQLLVHLHARGIIHRNLTPENIVLRQSDNKPVLLNFCNVEEAINVKKSEDGQMSRRGKVGTPGFMPSEQVVGEPSTASDLYTLGVTAVFLLTGTNPKDLERDSESGKISWKKYLHSAGHDLVEVIDKAIEPVMSDRFEATEAMLEAVQACTLRTKRPAYTSTSANPVYVPPTPTDPPVSLTSGSAIPKASSAPHAESAAPAPPAAVASGNSGFLVTGEPLAGSTKDLPEAEPAVAGFTFSTTSTEVAASVQAEPSPAASQVKPEPHSDFTLPLASANSEFRFEPTLPLTSLTKEAKEAAESTTYSFDTVTLRENGELMQRITLEAKFFVEELAEDVRLAMTRIPGGTFRMGSPKEEKDRSKDEGPLHQVTVKPFYMGKFQITQAQWRVVARLAQIKQKLSTDPAQFRGDFRPVEKVSWHNAIEFCLRLAKLTGKPYRLPSEAEWEFSCRAGTTTPFALGDTITAEFVNFDGKNPYGTAPEGNFHRETIPVGSRRVANGFGLYDMHGNVMEWCQDVWHDNYDGAPTDGSAWEAGGDQDLRIMRGGAWMSYGVVCRSAARTAYTTNDWLDYVGFRIALSES